MITAIRTVPEQVAKNTSDIKDLQDSYIGGVDIKFIDFSVEDLSNSPDFEKTLPNSSMDLTDVQSEQAQKLLKRFVKRGYIIVAGNLNKLFVVGADEIEIRAQFGFYQISLTATRIEINE